ncbi:hypothetical protein SOVF_177830 [Spinacia oleracea]|nr:hypothetical protein SOVF_177830 [Spinacia oleracea]
MISASSSNWLDRLRSSRGFPTGEEPDLDRILSSSSSGSAPTADSVNNSVSTQSQAVAIPVRLRRDKPAECGTSSGEFAGVLCDLFNMGGECSRSFSKKSSRKQANPRFCGASSESELPSSSDDLRREKSDNGGFVSSGDTSLNERRDNTNTNNNTNNNGKVRVDDFDEGEEDVDLKAYSRSEVTIIDTSFEEWKSDKWVFRKNDEWKIKEKKSKCKSRVSAGKKRKLLVTNLGDNSKLDDDQLKKKMKMKEADNLLQPNKGQPQNNKERRPTQKRVDFPGKGPQRRFPCPRPPEKSRNESSPVILLKSISSSNINAAMKVGKSFQKKHPKQMKIV